MNGQELALDPLTPLRFGLPEVVAAVIVVALNAYVLMGGADFGGGMWDLLARGPRRDAQRALIARTMGPIWEANHVWLIVAVVLLFTCFPPVFSHLSITLHIPLVIMLVGIVLRGSAFVFRSYGSPREASQRRWGRVFSIASLLTPMLLGVALGAVASGRLGEVMPRENSPYTFTELFVAPWLTPFAIGVGCMTVALFAFLAATYLTLETDDAALRDDFRARALGAAAAVFVAAFTTLAVSRDSAPHIGASLTGAGWAIPLQLATGVAALLAIWGLWTRRFRVARYAAGAQVSLILWGWALAQYPYLVPHALRIRDVAAPDITLQLVLAALAGGAVILIPSLVYLFRIFTASGEREARERRSS
jgi:cytochrome d ubiquinol oxidase subunit II